MSITPQSDLQQAVENVDLSQLDENLQTDASRTSNKQPKDLNKEQATPFIDENLRTDK